MAPDGDIQHAGQNAGKKRCRRNFRCADDEQPLAAADGEEVQPAAFPDLAGGGAGPEGSPNLEMIQDIEVMLSVELGRTKMLIDDVACV